MGLFSKKSKRGTPSPSAWPEEKWKGLIKSVTMSADMYCEKYTSAVAADRAEAAQHLHHGSAVRARSSAEQALRDRAKVRALAQLSVLASHLHSRSLAIDQHNSLADILEPARTELVSLVYASGRVAVQPLTEAVELLRVRFEHDVDDIMRAHGFWLDYVDTRLYDALTPGPADADLVQAELNAATRDHPPKKSRGTQDVRPLPSPGVVPGLGSSFVQPPMPPSHTMQPSPPQMHIPTQPEMRSPVGMRARGRSTHPPPESPLSPRRSVPSPRFGGLDERRPNGAVPKPWENARARVPLGVLGAARAPPPPPPPQSGASFPGNAAGAHVPEYMRGFQDSDEDLLRRYRDLLTT